MSSGALSVRVVTNSFEITRLPTRAYVQYDAFIPEVKPRSKRQELIHHLQAVVAPDVFGTGFLYDSRAIGYATESVRLSGGATFHVNLRVAGSVAAGSPGSTTITFTPTAGGLITPSAINNLLGGGPATPQSNSIINLLQLIIRQASNKQFTNNGKAYFLEENKLVLEIGIELRRGFFQSVRPTLNRMIVTVDTVVAAVYCSGPLINSSIQFLGKQNVRDLYFKQGDKNLSILERHLKKVLVTTETSNRAKKTIRGIVANAGFYEFDKDGVKTTIQEHYQEAHNIKLKYPAAFGILTRIDPPVVIPAELCYIVPGQLYGKKLPERLTSNLVKYATLRPSARMQNIMQAASGYNQSEYVAESGMTVNTNPISVNAKLLKPPMVTFKSGAIEPTNGAWNLVQKKVHFPAELSYWAVLNFCPAEFSQQDCLRRMEDLAKCCFELGMSKVEMPLIIEGSDPQHVEGALNHIMEKCTGITQGRLRNRDYLKKFILIVILPQEAAPVKIRVKRWGDVVNGVMTQCVRLNKIRSANNQYHNNVVLKLNARLGGSNSNVDSSQIMKILSQKGRTIVLGADVGHPGPGVKKPSVTSLVFSHDKGATQYAAITRIQRPRVEIIEALEEMVFSALDTFGSKNGPPAKIIFFRDGVSEGEFEQVSRHEISAIRAAIDRLWKLRSVPGKPVPTTPLLTFIVVGKRHHNVLFPSPNDRSNSVADKTGNCRAGVVVDSGITHPSVRDFYLQSHSAIQGTSRSSHYIVLQDEVFANNIAMVQELANALCYVYAKATRAVSIPSPVYYADLVCRRGAYHIDQQASGLTFADDSSVGSGADTFNMSAWEHAFKQTNDNLLRSMYFL